ncbi:MULTISPECIES: hypothetical protein [unclassified Pseudoalteromonas]|uniref:hypothetical protein n=1 Tax=unclassified Pseudoalteromonas TaxID=194690 RepID=UPI0025B53E43|nr:MULTISPECIES: hypothetical protein [unclassified Pseudoalteromonas]MDN3380976.1 hypothetical protein [Pseudoalteromonas sp. APC 3893]MDN3389399.1 hypothetical protein [Pseudoalteromonas sp. APC 4017]
MNKLLVVHLIEFAQSKDTDFLKFLNSNYSVGISHIGLDAQLKEHKLDLIHELKKLGLATGGELKNLKGSK